MIHRYNVLAAAAAGLLAGIPAAAQPPSTRAPAAVQPIAQPSLGYADLADLALTAPVAAHVRLRRAHPLPAAEAPGVRAGFSRWHIEADVVALIRGPAGLPAQLRYLVDLPNDARGRPARPAKNAEWLVFARALPGRPGELQLVAADAQIAFAPALAERTRAILRSAAAADAPPALTGIGRAFHTPGSIPGSGETQFFLLTAQNQPISITVAREPGRQARWFVSTSEFVDAGATVPERDTLLWYRLACTLPAQLPAASLADAGEHRQAIAADYRVVQQGLGGCGRVRTRR